MHACTTSCSCATPAVHVAALLPPPAPPTLPPPALAPAPSAPPPPPAAGFLGLPPSGLMPGAPPRPRIFSGQAIYVPEGRLFTQGAVANILHFDLVTRYRPF